MSIIPTVLKPTIRLTEWTDKHLPAYDYTMLSAVNTCPTWGLIRYDLGKRFDGEGRPIALEMGAALHEAFAAIRLVQLWCKQGLSAHSHYNMQRLFGVEKTPRLVEICLSQEEYETKLLHAALFVLRQSGFTNDASDRRRTIENAEEALVSYLSSWDQNAGLVWIKDPGQPESLVGVEIVFDIVLSFECDKPTLAGLAPPAVCVTRFDPETGTGEVSFRYVGRIDGLHVHGADETIFNHENKTAGRLDEAWRTSFTMSHQITGYNVASSLLVGRPVRDAYAIGLQIPQPKDYALGVVWEPVMRHSYNVERWLLWVLHTVESIWRWSGDPVSAPKYTHSCNRYFRPCSLVPFCYSPEDEQKEMLNEMILDKWSPLREINHKVGE